MSWNYRVIKRNCGCKLCAVCHGRTICGKCEMCARCHQHRSDCGGCQHETLYDIQEVYYNDDGSIYGYSDADVQNWESPEALKATLEHMLEAFKKPIIC